MYMSYNFGEKLMEMDVGLRFVTENCAMCWV